MKIRKALKTLAIGGILYSGFELNRAYQTAKSLIYTGTFPKNIRISLSDWILTFDFPVTVQNTRNDSITVNSFYTELFYKGNRIGNGYIAEKIVIPPMGGVTFPIRCVCSIQDMFYWIPEIDWTKRIRLDFVGGFTISTFYRLPFKYAFDLTMVANIVNIIQQYGKVGKSKKVTKETTPPLYENSVKSLTTLSDGLS